MAVFSEKPPAHGWRPFAIWSEDPASYQPGETYAEQLELENERIALVHLAPVIMQNDFLGTVSIFRDITHEVEVDRLKSEFVATVSHELRTPMTAIKGYVDILKMGAAGALNENQMHFLKIVVNNIERLNTLVNDLLDISRIDAGRVMLISAACGSARNSRGYDCGCSAPFTGGKQADGTLIGCAEGSAASDR